MREPPIRRPAASSQQPEGKLRCYLAHRAAVCLHSTGCSPTSGSRAPAERRILRRDETLFTCQQIVCSSWAATRLEGWNNIFPLRSRANVSDKNPISGRRGASVRSLADCVSSHQAITCVRAANFCSGGGGGGGGGTKIELPDSREAHKSWPLIRRRQQQRNGRFLPQNRSVFCRRRRHRSLQTAARWPPSAKRMMIHRARPLSDRRLN